MIAELLMCTLFFIYIYIQGTTRKGTPNINIYFKTLYPINIYIFTEYKKINFFLLDCSTYIHNKKYHI